MRPPNQPTRRRPVTQRATVLLLSALTAAPAIAQIDVSGSVGLQSGYTFRGQTPGDSSPSPQLTLNLDSASGWYAGGFAAGMHIGDNYGYKLQGYAGYALRLTSALSGDAGCSQIAYTQSHANDFHECYAGLSGERTSARLSYAPRYFGFRAKVLYAEISTFYPVHPRFNLIAHAGLLYNLSDGVWPGVPARSRYDLKLGVAVPFGNWTVQLAREHSPDDGLRYYGYPIHPAKAWSMGASYAF
nr:TorF family putative porin [Duganella margarita]